MFKRLWKWVKRLFKKPSRPSKPSVPVARPPVNTGPSGDLTERQERLVDLYETMEIDLMYGQTQSAINWYVNKCNQAEIRYKSIQEKTGVPWQVVACVHALEASFDFSKNLMNGQRWDRRTTWVPKGHGPWDNWDEAAVAAFELKRKEGKLPRSWGIGETLEFLLLFNGLGYEYKGLVSPYLWSFTNHYKNQGGGKYVSDGKFSRTAISKQLGAAVMLKELKYE